MSISQPQDELSKSKKVNDNLNQALQDMYALSDDISRVMVTQNQDEIVQIYFEVVSKILKTNIITCKYYEALSEDGPYKFTINSEGYVDSSEELPVDFEMIDYLHEELKPVTFKRDKCYELWIPMVRTASVLGITQVFFEDSVMWSSSVEERIHMMTITTASALQSSRVAADLISNNKEVENQSKRFKNMIEAINVGLLSLDCDRKIIQINRNASMMCRIGDYEIGQAYKEVLNASVCEVVDEMLDAMESDGFVMDRLIDIKIDQGNSISIGVNVTAFLDSDLKKEGYILTLRDMTAGKELERLRKIDQMKSDFVNNVSHELRTPLTSIAAYTEALQGMLEDETHQNFLGVISSEADRLLSLIENLLNVSRIESGKMTLHKEDLMITELVQRVVDITKVQSDKHQVISEQCGGIPTLMLDRDKMIEVLLNIVGNAIKYSPAGGDVIITTSLHDGNVCVAVSDQGIGLSKEDCQKVFDQFYRVDSSDTAAIGGTGLGLAITQSIVTAHGGVIKVESKLGEGSIFSVLFPSGSSGGSDEIELFDNDSVFS